MIKQVESLYGDVVNVGLICNIKLYDVITPCLIIKEHDGLYDILVYAMSRIPTQHHEFLKIENVDLPKFIDASEINEDIIKALKLVIDGNGDEVSEINLLDLVDFDLKENIHYKLWNPKMSGFTYESFNYPFIVEEEKEAIIGVFKELLEIEE